MSMWRNSELIPFLFPTAGGGGYGQIITGIGNNVLSDEHLYVTGSGEAKPVRSVVELLEQFFLTGESYSGSHAGLLLLRLLMFTVFIYSPLLAQSYCRQTWHNATQ